MDYISIAISLIALAVAIFALLIALKAKEKSRQDRIEYYAKQEARAYFETSLNRKVHDCVDNEMYRREHKMSKEQVADAKVDQPVTLSANQVIEKPESIEVLKSEDKKDGTEDESVAEISLPAPISIYVGSYKTGSFKYSSASPDGKTIYCITAGDKDAVEGIINIDPSAYDKVAETPDYLEGACIVSGNGTQVKVCKPGTVIKDNGQWVIKDSIEVELV